VNSNEPRKLRYFLIVLITISCTKKSPSSRNDLYLLCYIPKLCKHNEQQEIGWRLIVNTCNVYFIGSRWLKTEFAWDFECMLLMPYTTDFRWDVLQIKTLTDRETDMISLCVLCIQRGLLSCSFIIERFYRFHNSLLIKHLISLQQCGQFNFQVSVPAHTWVLHLLTVLII
jgi:hypothetical protein